MVSRVLFGAILVLVGLLYLWVAYQAVLPGITSGDWVAYLGAVLFVVTGVGAALAGVNLVRPKRR